MGGLSLGSAFFELNTNAASLIQEMAKAEAASKKSVEAISKATGVLEKDVQRLAQTYIREETRRAEASAQATLKVIKAYNDAGDAADRAAAKTAKGGEQSAAAFLGAAKGAGAFAAAAIGVQTGAAAINNALTSVVENTRKLEQAQFSVNKLYGGGAKDITTFSEQLAKTSGRSKADALEAAAAQATLARQYALTSEQQKQVLRISSNLAAVRGIPLADASKRVASALRGEAEAAEYLGQTLNSDAVKAMANMTDEQRKQFETLDPIIKAKIILGKLVGDNADLMDAASERTNTLTGQLDKLGASSANAGASVGQKLSPYLIPLIQQLNEGAEATDKWIQSWDLGDIERTVRLMGALGAAIATADPSRIAAELNRQQQDVLAQQAAASGVAFGPSPEEVLDTTARSAQLQAARRDAIKAFIDERKKAIETVADAREKAARAEAKATDEAIEREKIRLEVEKEGRLKALEERQRATIKAIEAEQRAEEKAAQANIERLEREKDLRLEAAQEAQRQAEQAIDEEERRLDRVREIEDRAIDDARRQEDRALDDRRRAEDRAREQSHEQELARIEERNKAALKAIEREADQARAASEKRMRSLERLSDREDERHRKAMQRLEDEQDARLDVLDTQLKALDAQERAERSAKRTVDLQRRLIDAQQASTRARGTGTPEQIAAARGDLTTALRIGDEVSIANARERLVKLAGQGNEAIKKADEELADVQEEIRQQGIDQTRDAEREQIRLKQDAIKADIAARKRAEDERTRERKRDLDADKQTERDKLKNRLDAIEKRQEGEREAAKQRLEDARAEYESGSAILADRRRDEDRALEDRRRKEDQDRADFRKAEDEKLRLQKEAVDLAYENERKATEAHYNGPNGLVTQARKAQEDMKEAHRLRLEDARLKFAAEREAIGEVYRNAAKTGLLDLQDEAAKNNKTKLDEQIKAIEEWKKDANKYIEENTGKWRDLEKAIKDTEAAIRGLPRTTVLAPNSQGGYGNQPYGPNEPGGRGEALPPPSIPPATGGSNTPPTKIPSQINQYTYDDLTRLEQDAACGPATIAWFSSMLGRTLTGRQAANIAAAAGWDTKIGMHGPSAMSAALRAVGVPNAVTWKVTDDLIDGLARRRVPFALSTGEHYYQVYGGSADGLNVGGSGLALRGGSSVMSLAAIRARGYEPQAVIVPDESVISTRDGGYLFTEPTMTVGMRSGKRNLIAELRPELLVSGARTADLIGPGPRTDYGRMSELAAAAWTGGSSRPAAAGDVINVNGVGVDEFMRRIEQGQNRKRLLQRVPRG